MNQSLQRFDPFNYVDTNEYDEQSVDWKHSYSRYTKEANDPKRLNRMKRQVNFNNKSITSQEEGAMKTRVRLNFPNERTMCSLYLRVDPFLYKLVFQNEGNRVIYFN
jgi:hypothetical protein